MHTFSFFSVYTCYILRKIIISLCHPKIPHRGTLTPSVWADNSTDTVKSRLFNTFLHFYIICLFCISCEGCLEVWRRWTPEPEDSVQIPMGQQESAAGGVLIKMAHNLSFPSRSASCTLPSPPELAWLLRDLVGEAGYYVLKNPLAENTRV